MESPTPNGEAASGPHLAVPPPTGEYLFGPFRLDVASMQLWRGDDLVTITPKAFDTLLVLIANRDRLLKKDELLAAVWPNSFVSEDSLAQNITVLRRTLGDDPNLPHYIATTPRRGYRFIGPVTERSRKGAASAQPAPQEPVPETPPPAPAPPMHDRRIPVWVTRSSLTAAVVGVLMFTLGRAMAPTTGADGPTLTLTVDAPAGSRLASGGVLSPDESSVASVTQDTATGTLRLSIRVLGSGATRHLEGTEGASRPFWSPDSQSVGFFANSKVKRVAAAGGTVQTLADYVGLTNSGASWGNGIILFANFKTGLWAVPETGGAVTRVTELDAAAGEMAHRWPQFLPDQRHFLYSVSADTPERAGVYLGSLDQEPPRKLLDEAAAFLEPSGHLLFIRDHVLLAQPFDARTFALTGTPIPVADDVAGPTNNNNAVVSASGNLLVYGGAPSEVRLMWVDRTGAALSRVSAPAALSNPTLTRDGRRALAGNGSSMFLLDLDRDVSTMVGAGSTPFLLASGETIAFTLPAKGGVSDIHLQATTGPPHQQLLLHTDENKFVNDVSRDGQMLVFSSENPQTKMDLHLLPLSGARDARPYLVSRANEFQAQISPDGRWLAYASDESGIWEVYVQAFPAAGGKRAISLGGGSEPQWRADGRELFYLSPDGTLMSVDIQTSGNDVQVSRRRALFRTPIPISGELNMRRNHYVPTADGQRFLMNAADEDDRSIRVLVNWKRLLRERTQS
jgi:DNA-binding winged helix-turn-helix (wHTH) protein